MNMNKEKIILALLSNFVTNAQIDEENLSKIQLYFEKVSQEIDEQFRISKSIGEYLDFFNQDDSCQVPIEVDYKKKTFKEAIEKISTLQKIYVTQYTRKVFTRAKELRILYHCNLSKYEPTNLEALVDDIGEDTLKILKENLSKNQVEPFMNLLNAHLFCLIRILISQK